MFNPEDLATWPAAADASPQVAIASDFKKNDCFQQPLDLSAGCVARSCKGLHAREGRVRLGAVWSSSLFEFHVGRLDQPDAKPLDLDWWNKHSLLVAIEPYARRTHTTSLQWCFAEDVADDPFDPLRRRGSVMQEVVIGWLEHEGDQFPREEHELLFSGSDDEADPADPIQYRCRVRDVTEYGYRLLVALNHSGQGGQKQKFAAECDKCAADWPRFIEILSRRLKESFGDYIYSHDNLRRELSAAVVDHREPPFVEPEYTDSGWTPTDHIELLHDPDQFFPELASAGNTLNELFSINRAIDDAEVRRRDLAKREARSRIETKIAELLTMRGFAVVIEPEIVFPRAEITVKKTPDLLVFEAGRMIAVEIDDSSHVVKLTKQGRPSSIVNWEKWQKDRDLDRVMLLHGIPVYRVSHQTASNEPQTVVAEVIGIFSSLSGRRHTYE